MEIEHNGLQDIFSNDRVARAPQPRPLSSQASQREGTADSATAETLPTIPHWEGTTAQEEYTVEIIGTHRQREPSISYAGIARPQRVIHGTSNLPFPVVHHPLSATKLSRTREPLEGGRKEEGRVSFAHLFRLRMRRPRWVAYSTRSP